jgi:iron complex transport system substrate-binding protein
VSSIKISELENTINSQTSQLDSYNEILTSQASQLEEFNQRITEQDSVLNQYNQTITQQNSEIEKYKQITLVDDFGYMVNITSYPQRIVSLAPSNTELLFAVGAGDRVVGVTDYCNYPYNFTAWIEAGNMTSIGNYWNPSIEPIIALSPDLILASGDASEEAASKLRNLGYNVLLLDAENLNDVLNDIFIVGRATNQSDQASALVTSLRTRIDTVANLAANASSTPKVYDEIWNDPLMAAGPRTFISDLIALAGGENIFDDAASQWPVVSSESVITKNPDIILSLSTDISTRSGWSSINAVKNNKIYQINDDEFSRPGPRLIDALEDLAKIVHPEIFGTP